MDLSKPHCFVKTNIMLLVIRRMAHIKQKKMIDRREKNGEKARQIQAPPPRPPHTHWNPVLKELAKYALSTEFSDLLLSMLIKS